MMSNQEKCLANLLERAQNQKEYIEAQEKLIKKQEDLIENLTKQTTLLRKIAYNENQNG